MVDPRLPRCIDRAASVLPWLEPDHLVALVDAVLGEVDDFETEREALAWAADEGLPGDLPAWGWKPVEDLVGPDPVWCAGERAFVCVAANPPVNAGDELLITFEDGVIARHEPGTHVRVAHNLGAAMAWNRRHAPVKLIEAPGPDDVEELGWLDPDSDAADRRFADPDDRGWAA